MASPATDCPLLKKLPRELRDKIFDLSIVEPADLHITTYGPASSFHLSQCGEMTALKTFHRLLLTNKQVRTEALDSFFRVNKFFIQLDDEIPFGMILYIHRASKPAQWLQMPSSMIANMRHVVLTVKTPIVPHAFSGKPGPRICLKIEVVEDNEAEETALRASVQAYKVLMNGHENDSDAGQGTREEQGPMDAVLEPACRIAEEGEWGVRAIQKTIEALRETIRGL